MANNHHKTGQEDIVHSLAYTRKKKRLAKFLEIPVNEQGLVLLSASRAVQEHVLSQLKNPELLKLLSFLDPDQVARLLRRVSKRRHRFVIKRMKEQLRDKVEYLVRFSPKTAAGIMSVDYIEVEPATTFGGVARLIREHESRTGKIPSVLVAKKGILVGGLRARDVVLYPGRNKIEKYIRRIPSIKYNEKTRKVISKFQHNPHNRVVVLDEDNSIMGVIYSDDVIALLQKEQSDSLYDFASVNPQEDALDPWWVKVRFRYKWLILNLATGFLAASVVSLFQETIEAFVLLAVYMPIIAGMGGNAGTQALVVAARGIALKEVSLRTGSKLVMRELVAGFINGTMIGILAAIVAVLWNKSPIFGLVVGISMIVNLMVSGLFGSFTPLVMKKFGRDPATSATIFITTATDVFGFLAFLSLARLML